MLFRFSCIVSWTISCSISDATLHFLFNSVRNSFSRVSFFVDVLPTFFCVLKRHIKYCYLSMFIDWHKEIRLDALACGIRNWCKCALILKQLFVEKEGRRRRWKGRNKTDISLILFCHIYLVLFTFDANITKKSRQRLFIKFSDCSMEFHFLGWCICRRKSLPRHRSKKYIFYQI